MFEVQSFIGIDVMKFHTNATSGCVHPVWSEKKLRQIYAVYYELVCCFLIVIVIVIEAFEPRSIPRMRMMKSTI